MVPRTMSSTVSACLTNAFHIKGLSYSLASACATGSHCIGTALEQIQMGKQDIVFAGGSDEEHWTQTAMFDAMGALSTHFNDQPAQASRPYDKNRDGFVVANGAGLVVVEELERAKKRGARIYGEIVGYGATADGVDMVSPSGEGAVRCIRLALASCTGRVDYINAHGTAPYSKIQTQIISCTNMKISFLASTLIKRSRSEERRVGKECRSRWSPEQ